MSSSGSSASHSQRPRQPQQNKQQQQQQQKQPGANDFNAAQQALAAQAAMKYASQAGVVRICGTAPSECGYCKGARARSPEEKNSSSKAYSLLADSMTPRTYEGFLYRGWRRSGTYLYKPDNWSSCCPALTIRLPVRDFVPTKSQRKVVKKMEQVLQPVAKPSSSSTMMEPENSNNSNPLPAKKRQKKNKAPTPEWQSPAEQAIQHAGILVQLQRWTQPMVQSYIDQYTAQQQHNGPWNNNTSATFKIKPPKGKSPKLQSPSQQQQQQTNNPIVTVCTTICASISGQSKGTIDRDIMSQHLAEQLQLQYCGKPQQSPGIDNNSNGTWVLQNVYRHAKSGQIFCDIQLSEQLVADANNTNNNTQPLSAPDATMADTEATTTSPKNKLQEWLEQHGASMAPFFMTANHPTSPSLDPTTTTIIMPPFSFTVDTLPAHESAMDPEVHKLYFLYQSRVHQDPDPYTCDLSGDGKNLNSSSSNMGAPTPTSEDGNPEDDEWSTPLVTGEDQVGAAFAATGDPKSATPTTTTSTSTTGTSNGGSSSSAAAAITHTEWVDKAKRMLHREYPNVSSDRLKQITKTFGSFFQFLVESPFVPVGSIRSSSGSSNNNNGPGPRCTVTTTPSATSNNNTPAITHLPCGTYHQQYRVGGMLIAVGVVDILPQGLSSVYLFYHPQFARDLVPLGKYAILQEIEFARSIQVPYYYLGYYIESCTKMKYKAEYRPSELLCPSTYKWVDAQRAQKIIQKFSPVHHCCTLYYDPSVPLDLSSSPAPVDNNKDENGLDQSVAMSDGDGNINKEDEMDVEDFAKNGGSSAPATERSGDPLFQRPAQGSSSSQLNSTSTSTTNSITANANSNMLPGILKKPVVPAPPPNPTVEQVKMDVGVGMPVTLSMLHERGRDTVRPLLEDFVKEAGPDLSRQCLVKFS